MKTILATTGLAAVHLLPTGVVAKPNQSGKDAAKAQCKAEREEMGSEAFAEEYGMNEKGKNAFGKCVSGKAAEKKAAMDAADAQEIAETKNAAKQCAAERSDIGGDAFAEEYGTNQNGRNPFGRCVSSRTQGG